jgi:L,D-transpeptidase catalytic domain
MAEDFLFNGTRLIWVTNGGKSYKSSSGLPSFTDPDTRRIVDMRVAKYQKYPDGPLPEGTYTVPIYLNGTATVVNKFAPIDPATGEPVDGVSCDLAAGVTGGLQKIPEKGQGNCAAFSYPGWGTQRIRLNKVSVKHPSRNNFYLHDSTKGFSHGCVEVEKSFFEEVHRKFHTDFLHSKKHTLTLRAQYPSPDASTNGGTLVPAP